MAEGLLAEPFCFDCLKIYCKAVAIAVICSGVNLITVPVVALNRVLIEPTVAIPVVINPADAPCLADFMMWLLLAGSSDPL